MTFAIHRQHLARPDSMLAPQTLPDEPLLAMLFLDMRSALGISVGELSARLNTPPVVILALESGRVSELPPWTETERIVKAYGALLQLDVGPALKRLNELLLPAATMTIPPSRAVRPMPEQATTAMLDRQATRASKPFDAKGLLQAQLSHLGTLRERVSATSRLKRSILAIAVLATLATGIAATVAPSGAIYGGLAGLSPALSQAIQQRVTRVSSRTGPDGLKWIDVSDPRSRKADRLQVSPAK